MGNGILVVCEQENGIPKKTAYELLSKARSLVAEVGGDLTALVIGSGDAADLGTYGPSAVYTVDGADFSSGATGAWVRALEAAVAETDPAVVLGAASARTREAFPRLAARLGAGMGTECTDLRAEGGRVVGRRPMYAGKAFADVHISSALSLFTVRPNSFPGAAPNGGTAAATPLTVVLQDGDLSARVVGTEEPKGETLDLAEADRIVSGGRPTDSSDNFDSLIRPLASALGATVGASRAAVDAGYAPHNEQVGQTGKVVNPSLYIACAISGAIQHLAGMRTSRVIVAINKNPEAPIFQHATYGIVGDIFEICPMLTEEAQRQGITSS
jgi:electron transfer flavoprotein alpha subunit